MYFYPKNNAEDIYFLISHRIARFNLKIYESIRDLNGYEIILKLNGKIGHIYGNITKFKLEDKNFLAYDAG